MTYQETELIRTEKARISVSMRQLISQLILDVDFTDFSYIRNMLDSIEKITGLARAPVDAMGDYAQFPGVLRGRGGEQEDVVLTMIEALKGITNNDGKLIDRAQTMIELSENENVTPAVRDNLRRRANEILADLDKKEDPAGGDPDTEHVDIGDVAGVRTHGTENTLE